MQSDCIGDNLPEMLNPIFLRNNTEKKKKKKKKIKMSSAECLTRVLSVKQAGFKCWHRSLLEYLSYFPLDNDNHEY